MKIHIRRYYCKRVDQWCEDLNVVIIPKAFCCLILCLSVPLWIFYLVDTLLFRAGIREFRWLSRECLGIWRIFWCYMEFFVDFFFKELEGFLIQLLQKYAIKRWSFYKLLKFKNYFKILHFHNYLFLNLIKYADKKTAK